MTLVSFRVSAGARFLRELVVCCVLTFLGVAAPAQTPGGSTAPQGDRGVLVLLSSGFGQRGIDNYVKGLHGVLNDNGLPYTRIHIEYLDLVKNSGSDYLAQLGTLMASKYPDSRIGVVVSVQSAALNFLLKEGAQIAPGAPILVAQARIPVHATQSGRKFFTQTSTLSYGGTLQRALDLFPDTQNVVFLNGTSPVEVERMREARAQFAPWDGKLNFEYVDQLSMDEIERKLTATPPNTVIIAPGINRDSKGQAFVPVDTIVKIAKTANAPVLPVYSVSIGLGALGGMVSVLEDEGKAMATSVLDWLARAPDASQAFTVQQAQPVALFDWAQIQRWGGDPEKLPRDTVFLNRPPSLWGLYKGYVIAGTITTIVLSALVVSLAFQNRRRLRAERSLLDSQKQYRLLADNMDDVLWVMNLDTSQWEYCSPSIEKLAGYSVAEVTQRSFVYLMDNDVRQKLLQLFRERMEDQIAHPDAGRPYTDTVPVNRSDGTKVWTESVTHYVRNEQGDLTLIGVTRDVTQRVSAQQEIVQLAYYDVLTHLPNRKNLHDRIQHAREATARDNSNGALLFIDLDHFKTLNDTRGHAAGDQLLREAGQRLTACVRTTDTVARLGGDEFVVLLEQLDSEVDRAASEAKSIATKILASFREEFAIDGQEHRITTSIGITLFSGCGVSADEILQQADMAMYRSKSAGRNGLSFFDPQMQAMVSARAALEVDLRKALHTGGFLLFFQPQVDMAGRVTGAEALIRWKHQERGLVSPGEFIGIAEDTGLILPIGDWVLESACIQLARWAKSSSTNHLTLAVNVSPRQFKQDDFFDGVRNTLQRTGARPDLLKLELTESMLLDNVDSTVARMKQLKTLGVGFSLDDFGTGYSSLAYLKRLPLDQLKIDKAFIEDVLSDSNDAAIARTVVALGQSLGLHVIAEGVETAGQRAFLADIGCLAYQGYFFSRPLDVEAFEKFLTHSP